MRATLFSAVVALVLGVTSIAAEKNQEKKKEKSKDVVTAQKYDDIALFGRVINFIEKQYVEPVKTKELVYGAIKGMLETLDPHSNFMPPEIYNQLKSDTSGKFGGLGLEVWVGKDGSLTVVSPMEGTPAWKAGIKPGDKLIKINGTSTKGMSLVEAVTKMRGEPGSKAEFTIQREGVQELLEFKLKRAAIDVKSVKNELLEDKYAYIRLTHFQEKSSREMKEALKQMESKHKISGMVLDLRNNPGGLLDEAADIANIFIDSGVIVSTIGRDKSQPEVKTAKSGIARLDFPLVVLVNGNSASAAEILAGAVKDHKRGLIVGSRTFGKGSVQTVIPLAEDVGLKLTIARYYTPNGTSIQATGIVPDIYLDEIDPDTYKKIKTQANYVRESDLKNHFDNEKDDGKDEKSGKDDKKAVTRSDQSPDLYAPQIIDPKEDYQVQQALSFLKSRDLLQRQQQAK